MEICKYFEENAKVITGRLCTVRLLCSENVLPYFLFNFFFFLMRQQVKISNLPDDYAGSNAASYFYER